MMVRTRGLLMVTLAMLMLVGGVLVVSEVEPMVDCGKPNLSVASRYPLRSRTPDFYARSKASSKASSSKKSCGR